MECADCVSRHFDLHVLSNPDLNSIVLETHNRTVNPTVCDNFVADLEIVDHLLKLLLAGLAWPDQKKVKDNQDYDKWPDLSEYGDQAAGWRGL